MALPTLIAIWIFSGSRIRSRLLNSAWSAGISGYSREPLAGCHYLNARARVKSNEHALCSSLRGCVDSTFVTGRRGIPTFASGLPQTGAAVEYAERAHAGQRRSDGTAFVLHPLEVASLLYYAGAPDHLIAAGALHDVLEKADVDAKELRDRFGSRIAELVLAVSDDDPIRSYGERKAALRAQVAGAGDEALTLFAADKLSKLRELRRETAFDQDLRGAPSPLPELRARRLRHYQRSLALLEERLPDSPLVRELREELLLFRRERSVLAARR